MKKREQLFTKKIVGGAAMYILAFFIILIFLIIYKASVVKERLYVTYDAVDDAIVTCLVSACVYNPYERGRSDMVVVFKDVTDIEEMLDIKYSAINDSVIYAGTGDSYLDNSYSKFVKNIKMGLELDDGMFSTKSGIASDVRVSEFSVYNKYWEWDEFGNKTNFRFVRYTRTEGGGWNTHVYDVNEDVYVYSTQAQGDVKLESTSVCAALNFDLKVGDYIDGYSRYSPAETIENVTYQRVVDVKGNL